MPVWLMYALSSALFAAGVSVLGKRGMEAVDPTAATIARSIIMAIFLVAFGMLAGVGGVNWREHPRSFVLVCLSGVAGALSWLCYFRAVHLAPVSKVAPIDKLSMPLAIVIAVILLGDRPGAINWIGIVLMTAGAYLTAK